MAVENHKKEIGKKASAYDEQRRWPVAGFSGGVFSATHSGIPEPAVLSLLSAGWHDVFTPDYLKRKDYHGKIAAKNRVPYAVFRIYCGTSGY